MERFFLTRYSYSIPIKNSFFPYIKNKEDSVSLLHISAMKNAIKCFDYSLIGVMLQQASFIQYLLIEWLILHGANVNSIIKLRKELDKVITVKEYMLILYYQY